MFKSPVRNVPAKKAPISFIKTVASPRQASRPLLPLTTKTLGSADEDYSPQHRPTSLLTMEVHLEKPTRSQRFAFPFHERTTIGELLDYLSRELA